jgi:hypothetical protein
VNTNMECVVNASGNARIRVFFFENLLLFVLLLLARVLGEPLLKNAFF